VLVGVQDGIKRSSSTLYGLRSSRKLHGLVTWKGSVTLLQYNGYNTVKTVSNAQLISSVSCYVARLESEKEGGPDI
jgi:hypothetical protein